MMEKYTNKNYVSSAPDQTDHFCLLNPSGIHLKVFPYGFSVSPLQLYSCIAMSVAAMLASTTALIIYFIDITRHQAAECARTDIHTTCVNEHYTVVSCLPELLCVHG